MATLQALTERVRLELADVAQAFSTSAVGDGVTKRFELPYQPLKEASLEVTINGTPIQPDAYTVDVQNGVITFNDVPGSGSVILTTGLAFKYFTDTTIQLFINTAFTQHSNGRAVTLASLPPVEDYLIALLATVEALYVLLTDATYDIDIMTPEGISIPRSQRRAAIMDMLQMRQSQYKELAAALNVGLHRIEMFDLRRVSRTTGRYVANYTAQELDDISPPRRVLPPIDTNGGPLPVDTVPVYNLQMIEGEPYSIDLDLSISLEGYTVKADLRSYPNSGRLLSFDVEIMDVAAGTARLRLDHRQTRRLGAGPRFWDLRLIEDATGVIRTILRGKVEIEQRASHL